MAIQYVDAVADACGHVTDTYNIGASNDQFSIAIDGGGNQVFTLTHGAARTAAQVVTDLAALTSATASVVTVNGVNYVRIRTTSAAGAASTILVNAPANNANTILGFIATTYTGGTNVNSTFVTSAKQDVISGIEDALNTAGWVTISGHHSTPCLMQSSMTPSTQNLRMRLRMTTGGTNCAILSIENVPGTKAGTNSGNNNGAFLLPGSSKTWRIVANKYQFFVNVPGSNTAREHAAAGVPWLPSWLAGGTVYEAIWLDANTGSDSDTTERGSFRSVLGTRDANGVGNTQLICNNNVWEIANNTGSTAIGLMSLITMFQGVSIAQNAATWYRWHDSSAFMTDPLIAWGLTANTDEAMARGQLWDSFISTEQYAIDTILTSLDSHNWLGISNNNGGSTNAARGTLFVVAP